MTAKSARQRKEDSRRRRGIKPKPVWTLRTQDEVAALLGLSRRQVAIAEANARAKVLAYLTCARIDAFLTEKPSGQSPGLAGPCLASRSDARVFEAPVLGAGPRSGRRGSL